ncbi:MAG: acyl-CoA dehydrogenase [Acidimicrobiales bacterium]|nr:MAG: acyl-CoA dehydrogenase [Acidimicrobiales bacterium]
MTEYRPPIEDIRFVLDELCDLDELSQLDRFSDFEPDTAVEIAEEFGRFAVDVLAPLNRTGDVEGAAYDPETQTVRTPKGFVEAYRKFVDGGWNAVPFPSEYGGGGLPWLVGMVLQEILTSANTSFSMCPLLTQGAIDLLLAHGSEEQKETFLRPMVSGIWTGTMNLTEPQAGSDVGALTTKATPAGDGTYRIKGTKIFITYGEHDLADQIVHLVLARVPDAPPGTKGISCFIVPKYLVAPDGSLGERNDVRCVSIEHKMGIHASPTCVMSYGDTSEGAVGYLVGEENQGMRYMFTMMNEARLSVGLQGLALAERAWQAALSYARERRQGRALGAPPGEQSPIIVHPDVRRMLMTMKAYTEAMRALIYFVAEGIDLSRHHLDPGIREAKGDVVALLTPVAKAWCTDVGCEVTSLAIQVHGGMGYIEETGVAQFFRDARIAPIYEGTNGIQAIDLVVRKLPLKGGAVVRDFLAMAAALEPLLVRSGQDLMPIKVAFGEALSTLAEATVWFFQHGINHPADALAAATPYLRMFGLVTGGWLLARSAVAAHKALEEGRGDERFLRNKIATARFYAENILPAVAGLLQPVTSGGAILSEIPFETWEL